MKDDDSKETKRQIFLDSLAAQASVKKACQYAGVARKTVYNWRHADAEFAKAWDKALDVGTDALEDEATRRAFEGWEEPVYARGTKVGGIRKFSDTLLIFLLKGKRPEKYAEKNQHVHTGRDGGPIKSEHTHKPDLSSLTKEQREQLAVLIRAVKGGGSE